MKYDYFQDYRQRIKVEGGGGVEGRGGGGKGGWMGVGGSWEKKGSDLNIFTREDRVKKGVLCEIGMGRYKFTKNIYIYNISLKTKELREEIKHIYMNLISLRKLGKPEFTYFIKSKLWSNYNIYYY